MHACVGRRGLVAGMRVDALDGRLQELSSPAVAEQQHVVAAGLAVREASEGLVRGE